MFIEYGIPISTSRTRILGWLGGVTRKFRSNGACNQAILKGGRHFDCSAHLPDVDCAFQAVFAQEDPRQVICDRAEPCDAQRLTPQIFKPVDLRLNEEPMIRPVGGPAHGDDRRAAQDRVNDRVAGRADHVEIAADQSLHGYWTGGNENNIGLNAVSCRKRRFPSPSRRRLPSGRLTNTPSSSWFALRQHWRR